jgi:hypothetical protein
MKTSESIRWKIGRLQKLDKMGRHINDDEEKAQKFK